MKKSQAEEWRSYLSVNGLCIKPPPQERSEPVEEQPVVSSSPPFVRAPMEDRSKYEKLTFNVDDLSSDSDENLQGEARELICINSVKVGHAVYYYW